MYLRLCTDYHRYFKYLDSVVELFDFSAHVLTRESAQKIVVVSNINLIWINPQEP